MGGGFCSGAGPQRFGGRPMARVQHRRPLHPGLRPVVWRLLRFGILISTLCVVRPSKGYLSVRTCKDAFFADWSLPPRGTALKKSGTGA